MRIFLYFARAYPGQSLVVLACLLLAGALDGLGLGTVLPLIKVAIHGDEHELATEGFEARVLAVLAWLGIPRELEALGIAVVVFFALRSALSLLAGRRIGYAVAAVATDLRLRLLRALLGASWGYFTRQSLGAAANAMATEADRGSRSYHHLTQILQLGVEAAVAVAVALAISWQVTAAAAACALLSVVVLNGFVRMSTRGGRKLTKVLKSLLARLTEVLGAVKLFKATAREPLVGPLLEDDAERLYEALKKQVLGKEALRALQEPIAVAFSVGVLIFCLRGLGMPFAEVLLITGLFARTLDGVGKMQRKYQLMRTEESALWSLDGMIVAAEERREVHSGTETPHLTRGVELRGVDFEYDGRPVLRRIEIEIPAGEVTALVGGSGAGKSTILDLVTGLVMPTRGELRVDGVPLPRLDLRRWRQMIGYVPQELMLFNASVRTNVTLGDPELHEADVERALRDAGAWDYVSELPEGLDAPVGERGLLLSGGQRQRLAIARALVHRPRLLILDEATAALDPSTEAAVWETVARLRGRTTVVGISHQPALAGVADRVYRIEGGTAVRVGGDELPAAAGRRA